MKIDEIHIDQWIERGRSKQIDEQMNEGSCSDRWIDEIHVDRWIDEIHVDRWIDSSPCRQIRECKNSLLVC